MSIAFTQISQFLPQQTVVDFGLLLIESINIKHQFLVDAKKLLKRLAEYIFNNAFRLQTK